MTLTIDEYGRSGQYGLSFNDGAMSALMAPAPIKDRISAKSRLRHGKVVIKDNQKMDERELTLLFHITASTKAAFWTNLNDFFRALEADPTLDITLSVTGQTYRLLYISCTQCTTFAGGMAEFSLKVCEPNPGNRSGADSDYGIANDI